MPGGVGCGQALLDHSCPHGRVWASIFLIPFLALQDAAYHCTAALFYLSASVLEALATIMMHNGFTYKYYHENISAVVSPHQPSMFPAPTAHRQRLS